MKKLLLTITFLLLAGFVFSQTTNTDTTRSKTTTLGSTKLVKKRVNIAPVKKVTGKKEITRKNSSQPSGKKEEEK